MDLSNASLSQVETAFRNGQVDRAEVVQYLREWNAGPHFTQAVLTGRSILNFEPENMPAAFRTPEKVAEFGLRL